MNNLIVLSLVVAALLASDCGTRQNFDKGTELQKLKEENAKLRSEQEKDAKGSSGEEPLDQLEKGEHGFKADDGCRDLYYRIRDEGGHAPEAIAVNIQSADKSITYNLVEKNALPFYGKPIVITGRIEQIVEFPAKDGSFFTDLLVMWGNQPVMVSAGFQVPFVKGNRVTVIGYLAKHLYHYKSIAQWDMAVPLVIARAVLKPTQAEKLKTLKPTTQ